MEKSAGLHFRPWPRVRRLWSGPEGPQTPYYNQRTKKYQEILSSLFKKSTRLHFCSWLCFCNVWFLPVPQKYDKEILFFLFGKGYKTNINRQSCLIKGTLVGASLTDALISNHWLTLVIAIYRGGGLRELSLLKLQTSYRKEPLFPHSYLATIKVPFCNLALPHTVKDLTELL